MFLTQTPWVKFRREFSFHFHLLSNCKTVDLLLSYIDTFRVQKETIAQLKG